MPAGRHRSPGGAPQLRSRVEADLDQVERLAQVVHRADGYPPHLPGDLRGFLASPDALGAWVALVAGEICGHVALHRRSSEPVIALAAEATGAPPARLAVVARLLVAPRARRAGLGATLLAHAADEARGRGLRPVLDVATHLTGAVARTGRPRPTNLHDPTWRATAQHSLDRVRALVPVTAELSHDPEVVTLP